VQRIIITTDGQVITDEALETAKDIQKCLALRKKYLYQAKVPAAIRAFFSLFDAVQTRSHLRMVADSVALLSRLCLWHTPADRDSFCLGGTPHSSHSAWLVYLPLLRHIHHVHFVMTAHL
jgi:hypothetical protein